MGRKRLARAELRDGAAVDVHQGAAGAPILTKLGQSRSTIAKRPDKPQGIPGLAPRSIRHAFSRMADRRQAEHARSASGEGDRVAADEGEAVALARGFDAVQE